MTAGNEAQILADRFINFAGKVDDLSMPLTQVGANLRERIAGQFSSEGAGGYSGEWAPLSPAYGAWKERHAPGTPILVGIRPTRKGSRQHPNQAETYSQSGRMRDEVLDPEATMVFPMRLMYAPTSDIAGFHQTGTSRMPARPIVSLYPSDIHVWDRYFAVFLNEMIKDAEL
jgi:hypothetical protein